MKLTIRYGDRASEYTADYLRREARRMVKGLGRFVEFEVVMTQNHSEIGLSRVSLLAKYVNGSGVTESTTMAI